MTTTRTHRGLQISVSRGMASNGQPLISLAAQRDGQRVGTLGMLRDSKGLVVHEVNVEPHYRQTGIATALYEMAGQIACRDSSAVRSDHTRSAFAEAFWRKQARKGRAACIELNRDRDDNVYRTPMLELRAKLERDCNAEHWGQPQATEACADKRMSQITRRLPTPKGNGRTWACLRWGLRGDCPRPDLSGLGRFFGGSR